MQGRLADDTPILLEESFMKHLPDAALFALSLTLVSFLVGDITGMVRNMRLVNDAFVLDYEIYQTKVHGLPS